MIRRPGPPRSCAPHVGPVDPHRPLGACCVYKITNIATGKAYIGKTVQPLEEYIKLLKKRPWHFGRALRKYGRTAFRSEILLVGTEDFCFRDVIDGKRGGMERALIAAYGTLSPGGYNLSEGGEGLSSAEARRGGEVHARRAGYPTRRVLEALEKGPRSIASLVASLGLTGQQIRSAQTRLLDNGHHILVEGGGHGLLRLIAFEEAADDWASGRAVTIAERVLGLLMEGPRTRDELAVASGMPRNSADASIPALRENGYNIESRGSNGRRSILGTYHLIIDHNRHPWMHVGMMDLRGAALDDRCNSVANEAHPC